MYTSATYLPYIYRVGIQWTRKFTLIPDLSYKIGATPTDSTLERFDVVVLVAICEPLLGSTTEDPPGELNSQGHYFQI